MIATSRYFFLLVTSQLISLCLLAQMMDDTNGTKIFKPEFRRLINHEAIDREQTTCSLPTAELITSLSPQPTTKSI